MLHMYKNQLQQYSEKKGLGFPVYTCEAEGPPHAPRFKSRVSFDGISYETMEFFPTLKEAEQAAAKVVCQVLSVDVNQEDRGLYKKLLEEFVQKKGLRYPSYETISSGLSHRPLFLSTVEIGNDTFQGAEAKTKKEAEMNAAKVAYFALTKRFSATESSMISPIKERASADTLTQVIEPAATVKKQEDATEVMQDFWRQKIKQMQNLLMGMFWSRDAIETPRVIPQQNSEDNKESPRVYKIAICNDKNYKDMLHMSKNQLQQYSEKKGLGFPVYTCEAEGPPHAPRFKSRVSFDGISYETMEFFPTLKEAEQAAAKVVCQVLSVDVNQEDRGLYKKLLEEFVQKKGLRYPSYETISSGLSHGPLFLSTVEIGNDTFQGAEAKTKKEAEMNAAKVAYFALTKRFSATESSMISPIKERASADTLTQVIEPAATVKKQEDATEETHAPEVQIHSGKTESLSEDMNIDAQLPHQSDGSNLLHPEVENLTSAEPVTKELSENQSSKQMKIVVQPRRSGLPIPSCGTVMPCSSEEWVTYKIEMDREPTA